MNRFRVTAAAFFCAALMTVAACGGDDSETTAGSTPSGSAAPTTAAASSAPAAAGGQSDKELCESVKKAGDEMKEALIAALSSGEEPEPAVFKEILTGLSQQVTTLSASGEADSKVVAALKTFGAEATKAASAADPATASEDPAFEKAGGEITAACKTAGVDVNF